MAAYEEKMKAIPKSGKAAAKSETTEDKEARMKESQETLRRQLEMRRAKSKGKGTGEVPKGKGALTVTASVRRLAPAKAPPNGIPEPKTPPGSLPSNIANAPWRRRSRSPARNPEGKGKGKDKNNDKTKEGKRKNTKKGAKDLNSLGREAHDTNGVVTWNLDTGAAASAAASVMPSEMAKQLGEAVKGEEVRFKTASGELLTEKGSWASQPTGGKRTHPFPGAQV